MLTGGCALADDTDPITGVTGIQPGSHVFVWEVYNNGACPLVRDTMQIIYGEAIFIPDAFSPNGDGTNDRFVIRGLETITGIELVVFNRWGNRLWFDTNYANTWTGVNQNGEPLSDDTYYYLLSLPSGNVYKGFVVIKR
jgi:gliding motility-associated-like protein